MHMETKQKTFYQAPEVEILLVMSQGIICTSDFSIDVERSDYDGPIDLIF